MFEQTYIQNIQRAMLGAFQNVNPFTSFKVVNSKFCHYKELVTALNEEVEYESDFVFDGVHHVKLQVKIEHILENKRILDENIQNYLKLDEFIDHIGLKTVKETGNKIADLVIGNIMSDKSIDTIQIKDGGSWLQSANTLLKLPPNKLKRSKMIVHPIFFNELKRGFLIGDESNFPEYYNTWEAWSSDTLDVYCSSNMPEYIGFLFTEDSLLVPMPRLPAFPPFPDANDIDEETGVSIRLVNYKNFTNNINTLDMAVAVGVGYIPGGLVKIKLPY